MIEVDGKMYKVTETLPYHQVGIPTKCVETSDGEKVAVNRGDGKWTWWTVKDRV